MTNDRSSRKPERQPGGRERAPSTFTAFGIAAEAGPLAPGLYVVATPIGNLADITIRALRTLAGADSVVAEDTRVTARLLAHYGITTPLTSYHDHSGESVRQRLLARLAEGGTLALVSDAGTPLVSDPGFRLVEGALAAGIPVIPVPGASAALAGLVASGLPSDRFFFEGFLPAKSGARRARLRALLAVPATLVIYEAPHRIAETLADADAVLGARPAAVARELTKFYETVRRGSLSDLAAAFAGEPTPKGEIVLLIGPPGEEAAMPDHTLDERLRAALGRHSVKDAAAIVAAESGQQKREVYARAVALAKDGEAS